MSDDSFIMHNRFVAYGKLEETMRRAYHDKFYSNIKVKKNLITEVKPINNKTIINKNFFDDISADIDLKSEHDYLNWRDRDNMWMSRLLFSCIVLGKYKSKYFNDIFIYRLIFTFMYLKEFFIFLRKNISRSYSSLL